MTIQFGAHCYLFTERWSDASLPILERLRVLGGEVLEIAVGDDVEFSPQRTRAAAAALGMQLVISPGGEWPLECDLSSEDKQEQQRGLAWHKQNIELASELEALAYSGALYGHTGVVERRRPPAAESERVADGLRELAEFAAAHDVLLAIEPMSHFRTHLINTPAQALQLVSAAGHENLRVLLDTYHLVTEVRDYRVAILEMGERLWGVHACESDRGVPGGGLVPWDQVAAGLAETHFTGPVMLESYNSALGDFAYRRGMFHNVCPDGDMFVRAGFSFLRDLFGID